MKRMSWITLALAATFVLVACDMDDDDDVVVQSSSSVVQSSESSVQSSESSSAQSSVATTELDGTFAQQRFDETKTLVISQGVGNLQTVENDGETEQEQVQVDGAAKTIRIGDDLYTYALQGSSLTLTDDDGEQEVYTKQ